MIKKDTRIEIFFWLAAFLVFSPRILVAVWEHRLAKELIPFGDNVWRVKDTNGNIIYEKLKLPYDLRNTEEKTSRRAWVFEKEVDSSVIDGMKDVGIILGRIGDSDYVKFNDCLIGSTALNLETMAVELRGWSMLRKYQVPSHCIKYPSSKIEVHVYKWDGPGFGIFGGPMGFGNYSKVSDMAKFIDFFRNDLLAAYGLGLIFFIGIQYLLIALLSQSQRLIYAIFAVMSINAGIYLITNSKLPSQLVSHFGVEKRLLFFSAVNSMVLFMYFLYKKVGGFKKILLQGFTVISMSLMIWSMFQNDHSFYSIYERWFPFLLLTYIICYVQSFFGRTDKKDIYYWKYFLAYTVFLLCVFHDVIVTVFGLSSAYMVGYAYTFFVVVVALTLSREYADAYDRVEDQVELRTSELNRALSAIKSVQKLKDEQARTFAHDIRSPLSALQVLRDTIEENISQDQGTIFNDTIVRINDLANTILPKDVPAFDDGKRVANSVFLWTLVDKLLSEKRVKYQNIPDFLIEAKSLTPLFDIHAICDEQGLKNTLSKVFDYCVDTRKLNQPFILTTLIEKKNDKVEIVIQDNGKGIPLRFEPSTGESTVGQDAKKLIQSWGGDIDVYSTENVGHTVTIHLKAGERPDWLASRLDLTQIENFIVLDGQRYVIDTWKQKLRQLDKNFNIYWAKNAEEWKKYNLEDLAKKQSIFLIDQNLSPDSTGLEFIQKFKLSGNAVLVSANEDDRLLRVKARALNISILPKSLIYAVPVEI